MPVLIIRRGSVRAFLDLQFAKTVVDPLSPLRDAVATGRLGAFTVDRDLEVNPSESSVVFCYNQQYSLCFFVLFFFCSVIRGLGMVNRALTADLSAQLVEHRTTVPEVASSYHGQTNTQGLKITERKVLSFLITTGNGLSDCLSRIRTITHRPCLTTLAAKNVGRKIRSRTVCEE